ncbi:hypothetical protein EN793_34470, partial [Mesorhizobium sp. M4B.F.Ca.ET.150.01.1.1]
GKAFKAFGIDETEDEARYRHAACLLADIGWTAYGRGNRGDAGVQNYARATDKMAQDYAAQLRQCGN